MILYANVDIFNEEQGKHSFSVNIDDTSDDALKNVILEKLKIDKNIYSITEDEFKFLEKKRLIIYKIKLDKKTK